MREFDRLSKANEEQLEDIVAAIARRMKQWRAEHATTEPKRKRTSVYKTVSVAPESERDELSFQDAPSTPATKPMEMTSVEEVFASPALAQVLSSVTVTPKAQPAVRFVSPLFAATTTSAHCRQSVVSTLRKQRGIEKLSAMPLPKAAKLVGHGLKSAPKKKSNLNKSSIFYKSNKVQPPPMTAGLSTPKRKVSTK